MDLDAFLKIECDGDAGLIAIGEGMRIERGREKRGGCKIAGLNTPQKDKNTRCPSQSFYYRRLGGRGRTTGTGGWGPMTVFRKNRWRLCYIIDCVAGVPLGVALTPVLSRKPAGYSVEAKTKTNKYYRRHPIFNRHRPHPLHNRCSA